METDAPTRLVVGRGKRTEHYSPGPDLDRAQAQYEDAERAYTRAVAARRDAARRAHDVGKWPWRQIAPRLNVKGHARAREIAHPRGKSPA